MTEQIKNELGRVIGYKDESSSKIYYRHIKGGLLGTFDKSTLQYYRKDLRLGISVPLTKVDYGFSDILAYDKMFGNK